MTLPERLKALGERYVVGKFYQVPCVLTTKAQTHGRGEWVPVIGPMHTDKEHIQFETPHWHADYRFTSEQQLLRARWTRADFNAEHYTPVQLHGHRDPENMLVLEGPKLRRMKCKRPMPAYVYAGVAKWHQPLEDAFKNVTMKNMVCPHRGIPLEGCETHGDVVTCPAHGLRWNFKTGALVTDAARPTACATDGGGNG